MERASMRAALLGGSLALALAAALPSGCGGPGGGSGDAGPLAAEQYCSARAAALCSAQVRCGNVPAQQEARCQAMFTAWPSNLNAPIPPTGQAPYCIGHLLGSLLADDRVTFDPKAAGSCVEAIRNAACDQALTSPAEPAACSAVVTGKRAIGDPCDGDLECVTGYCSGVCAEPSKQSCRNIRCAPGYYCDNQGDASWCHPKVGERAGCRRTDECEPEFICDWFAGRDGGIGSSGTCVREHRLALGERCLNSTGMDNETACVDGLFCNKDGVCAPLGSPGTGCSNTNWDSWWIRRGGCQVLTECLGGACTLLPGVGEPCADPKCPSPPAICEENALTICLNLSKCSDEISLEGTCQSFFEECGGTCRSGLCELGKCQDWRGYYY